MCLFIYCFAHQLQLALIFVAKKYEEINSFFNLVPMLVVNVVGASTKRLDILQKKHAQVVIKTLNDKLSSGQSLNQEITLKRSVDIVGVHIMVCH